MARVLLSFCVLLGVVAAAPQSAPPSYGDGTTLTYTATTTATEVATVTGNATVCTVSTYTRPYQFPAYSYIYNETLTTTYTTSEHAGTLITPSSTVTAPTPDGFIPLLQESPYTDPITIVKETATTTSTSTYDPSPTTLACSFVMVYQQASSTMTTTTASYVAETTTVTSTTTSAPPVYTKYDACAPDNLATRIPTGQFIDSSGEPGEDGYDVIFTANAEDCCGYCQGLDGCFGGTWETGPNADFPGRCFVLTIATDGSQTCNASNPIGEFFHQEGSVNGHGTTAFNGPCGYLPWVLTDADYFP